ncbi:MAG TPA: DUF1015 domain-containing protein, partial [Chloroflexota bacterium]|nr:DUF1015 domain-containing protein [Chloroflexota bacterium]
MPRVLPLAGLRYAASSAELPQLISPPYDVISPDEQVTLRALSPHNAIHVELPADEGGVPGSRYRAAAARLAQWRREGMLQQDAPPAYYLSETRFMHAGETLRRRDLLAALAAEPWASGAVLPHEHTMSGPKADRLELLRATHLNASPIWVLFRDRHEALEQAWSAAETREPTYEFSWRGEDHRLWAIDDDATLAAIQAAFAAGGPL